MSRNIILDTGVTVALINQKEERHEWIKKTLKGLSLKRSPLSRQKSIKVKIKSCTDKRQAK